MRIFFLYLGIATTGGGGKTLMFRHRHFLKKRFV
jgi:hypothetical protein